MATWPLVQMNDDRRAASLLNGILDGTDRGIMTTYTFTPAAGIDDARALQQRLQSVIDQAQPGDTILLQPGTYYLSSSLRIHGRNGTEQKPLVISSTEGGRAILDASRITDTGYYGGWAVDIRDSTLLRVKGLDIRHGPEGGLILRGGSHFNILENLDIHHNGRLSSSEGKGLTLTGSGRGNLLLNNDSHHNADLRLDNADGFQISSTGLGNVLHGNRAWSNADDGFDLFNVVDGSKPAPVVLHCNVAFANGFVDDRKPAGDGVGFKLGGSRPGSDGVSGGHRVEFNLAWGNRSIGFDENGATIPMSVTRNVAIDHENYNFFFENTGSTISKNLSLGFGRVTPIADPRQFLDAAVANKDVLDAAIAAAAAPRQPDGSLPALAFSIVGGPDEAAAQQTCGAKWQSGQLASPHGTDTATRNPSAAFDGGWALAASVTAGLTIFGIVSVRMTRRAWVSSRSLPKDHGPEP